MIDPRYIRAARALLDWSQADLAKAAGIAHSTVADYERGARLPAATTTKAIQDAMEARGIAFLDNGVVEADRARSWLFLPP